MLGSLTKRRKGVGSSQPWNSSSLVCAAATKEEEPTQLLSLRLLTLDSLSLSPLDLLVDSRPSSLDQLF